MNVDNIECWIKVDGIRISEIPYGSPYYALNKAQGIAFKAMKTGEKPTIQIVTTDDKILIEERVR